MGWAFPNSQPPFNLGQEAGKAEERSEAEAVGSPKGAMKMPFAESRIQIGLARSLARLMGRAMLLLSPKWGTQLETN